MRFWEFFQDHNGQFSNTRLANLLVIITFTSSWIAHIVRAQVYEPSWSIVSLVAGVMGIKAWQKFAEKKI